MFSISSIAFLLAAVAKSKTCFLAAKERSWDKGVHRRPREWKGGVWVERAMERKVKEAIPVVWQEIEKLRRASVSELQTKYFEVFGQESRSNHKQFLFRRITWRLQALAYGDLSEQVRRRALALAQDVDLRIKAPQHLVGNARQLLQPTLRSRHAPGRDKRLPAPGSILRREFKGQIVVVQVLADGFQYQDRFFKSLSAIARQATGTAWNGYAFFRLKVSKGQ